MAIAAGTTTIPIMVALAVAIMGFLAWAAFAVQDQRAAVATSRRPVRVPALPALPALPAPVQVVVGRQYTVAAPDEAAVQVAMARRVRPPMPFPTPARPTPAHEEPATAMPLPRSA